VLTLITPEGPDSRLEVLDGPARRTLGQLEGRRSSAGGARNDGTPDRAMHRWLVRAPQGARLVVSAEHPRAGTVTAEIVVAG
jgi:hypothetical protein